MILFFVLAGFIAKESVVDLSVKDFVKSRLASRFVPFFFFNLLLALVSLGAKPDFPPFPLDSAGAYLAATIQTVTVLPIFNIPSWFLMSLITVEVLHYVRLQVPARFRRCASSSRRWSCIWPDTR